jgi:hypothetical protein
MMDKTHWAQMEPNDKRDSEIPAIENRKAIIYQPIASCFLGKSEIEGEPEIVRSHLSVAWHGLTGEGVQRVRKYFKEYLGEVQDERKRKN